MGKPVTLELDPNFDSSSYIFDVVFECKVRNLDLLSDQDLRDYGSYSTGLDIMDADNMTQFVSANMTIAQMAEHSSKGYPLRFSHACDVLKIYEFTQHHLYRWVGELGKTNLNGIGAPVDDLLKLDVFCSVVYEQAKYYDQAKLTSLEQRFGTDGGFNSIKNMFNKGNDAVIEKQDKIQTQHRKGFSDLFKEIQMKKTTSMDGINMPNLNG